ncbi:uncharacterized protein LOC132293480 [Cornus florida]|uniref:uncharacterized protein LOC132293480 n=1 Tax=Cornus florida TaxID=4283 RepID=UPI002897A6B2|nr:uncharacterized protein LOC132293480 [Cornus florida]
MWMRYPVESRVWLVLFSCLILLSWFPDSKKSSGSHKGRKGMHWALIIKISALVSTVFIPGLLAAYKYWQKRERDQDHVRFLKLFEDGSDIEDELGIGPLGGVI